MLGSPSPKVDNDSGVRSLPHGGQQIRGVTAKFTDAWDMTPLRPHFLAKEYVLWYDRLMVALRRSLLSLGCAEHVGVKPGKEL